MGRKADWLVLASPLMDSDEDAREKQLYARIQHYASGLFIEEPFESITWENIPTACELTFTGILAWKNIKKFSDYQRVCIIMKIFKHLYFHLIK